MKRYPPFIVLVSIIVFAQLQAMAQYESFKNPKISGKAIYVSGGQDQTVHLKDNKTIKINVVFYPKLTYKIEIIPIHAGLTVAMDLFSEQDEKYFTNRDKNYLKFWHFCFQSITNCTLEISSVKHSKTDEQVQVNISYLQNQ